VLITQPQGASRVQEFCPHGHRRNVQSCTGLHSFPDISETSLGSHANEQSRSAGLSRPSQVRLKIIDLSARNSRIVSDGGERQSGESLKAAFNVTVVLAIKGATNM
jgi:hypothetical protein